MLRFGFEQFGGPEVFKALDVNKPEPKAGQVQLQVLGFGLNPYDAMLRRGEQAKERPLSFPIVPGTDVIGRITKLGAEVSDFSVGDVVLNFRPLGGYSEFITATAKNIYKKPTALSFLDAAALPQIGLAAYNILHYILNVEADKRIAIVGASGGVGSMLVQLSKFLKLNVIAVANDDSHDYLNQLGADEIFSYEDDLTNVADSADYVVNAVFGGKDRGASLTLVKPDGQYVTTAYFTPDLTRKPQVHHEQLGYSHDYSVHDGFAFLVDAAQKWGLSVRVLETFPFSRDGVVAAHERLDSYRQPGKLVVMQDRQITHPVRKDINHL